MISIIIPAYNAHQTIEKTIASIAVQTISDQIEIILINDASDKGYEEIIKKFKSLIKIKYIKNKENLGIGITRQIGVENVTEKYFAFIDSDDIFLDAMAFEKMVYFLEQNENNIVCYSEFLEEKENKEYVIKGIRKEWTFGKLYRTSFIKKYDIQVPPINSNEDQIFNIQIEMFLQPNHEIVIVNENFYLWKYNPKSITRKNNFEYWYHQDVIGVLKGFSFIKFKKEMNKQLYNDYTIQYFLVGIIRYLESKEERYKEKWFENIFKELNNYYQKHILSNNIVLTEYLIKNKIDKAILPYQKKYFNLNKIMNLIKNLSSDNN